MNQSEYEHGVTGSLVDKPYDRTKISRRLGILNSGTTRPRSGKSASELAASRTSLENDAPYA